MQANIANDYVKMFHFEIPYGETDTIKTFENLLEKYKIQNMQRNIFKEDTQRFFSEFVGSIKSSITNEELQKAKSQKYEK